MNANEPAYPNQMGNGLTKREFIAAQFMAAMVSNSSTATAISKMKLSMEEQARATAKTAIRATDILLAELERTENVK